MSTTGYMFALFIVLSFGMIGFKIKSHIRQTASEIIPRRIWIPICLTGAIWSGISTFKKTTSLAEGFANQYAIKINNELVLAESMGVTYGDEYRHGTASAPGILRSNSAENLIADFQRGVQGYLVEHKIYTDELYDSKKFSIKMDSNDHPRVVVTALIEEKK